MAVHGEARAMQSDKSAGWLALFGISYRRFFRKRIRSIQLNMHGQNSIPKHYREQQHAAHVRKRLRTFGNALTGAIEIRLTGSPIAGMVRSSMCLAP